MKTAFWNRGHRCAPAASQSRIPAVLERMEERRHLSISSWSDNYITDMSSYQLHADALFGGNSSSSGIAGLDIGTPSAGITDTAFKQWDSNLADGLDSGTLSAQLTADAGSATWQVSGGSKTMSSSYAGSSISSVAIRAAVTGSDMAFTWSNVVVKFYSEGALMETDSVSSGPQVNTYNGARYPAECVVVVTPGDTYYDKVVVTGSVRLQAAQGSLVNPNSIFGQVFVATA
jgi:hypothetical protein